eukprot:UC4_evm4s13
MARVSFGDEADEIGEQIEMEEEYDPNYEPTQEDIEEFAKVIGMDLDEDKEFFWIAREALKAKLPDGWKPCLDKGTNDLYYFNFDTGESSWEHPSDEFYRKKFENEKEKARSRMRKSSKGSKIKSSTSSSKDQKSKSAKVLKTPTNKPNIGSVSFGETFGNISLGLDLDVSDDDDYDVEKIGAANMLDGRRGTSRPKTAGLGKRRGDRESLGLSLDDSDGYDENDLETRPEIGLSPVDRAALLSSGKREPGTLSNWGNLGLADDLSDSDSDSEDIDAKTGTSWLKSKSSKKTAGEGAVKHSVAVAPQNSRDFTQSASTKQEIQVSDRPTKSSISKVKNPINHDNKIKSSAVKSGAEYLSQTITDYGETGHDGGGVERVQSEHNAKIEKLRKEFEEAEEKAKSEHRARIDTIKTSDHDKLLREERARLEASQKEDLKALREEFAGKENLERERLQNRLDDITKENDKKLEKQRRECEEHCQATKKKIERDAEEEIEAAQKKVNAKIQKDIDAIKSKAEAQRDMETKKLRQELKLLEEQDLRQLSNAVSDKRKAIDEQRKLDQELYDIEKKHRENMDNARENHKRELSLLETEQANEKSSKQSMHSSEIAAMKESHDRAKKELETMHSNELGSIKKSHKAAVEALKKIHDKEIERAKSNCKEEIEEIKDKGEGNIKELHVEIQALRDSCDKEKCTIETEHKSLKEQVESRNIELQVKIAEIEGKETALKARSELLTKDQERMEARFNDADKALETVKKEITHLNTSRSRLQKELDEIQKNIEDSSKELKDMDSMKEEAKKSLIIIDDANKFVLDTQKDFESFKENVITLFEEKKRAFSQKHEEAAANTILAQEKDERSEYEKQIPDATSNNDQVISREYSTPVKLSVNELEEPTPAPLTGHRVRFDKNEERGYYSDMEDDNMDVDCSLENSGRPPKPVEAWEEPMKEGVMNEDELLSLQKSLQQQHAVLRAQEEELKTKRKEWERSVVDDRLEGDDGVVQQVLQHLDAQDADIQEHTDLMNMSQRLIQLNAERLELIKESALQPSSSNNGDLRSLNSLEMSRLDMEIKQVMGHIRARPDASMPVSSLPTFHDHVAHRSPLFKKWRARIGGLTSTSGLSECAIDAEYLSSDLIDSKFSNYAKARSEAADLLRGHADWLKNFRSQLGSRSHLTAPGFRSSSAHTIQPYSSILSPRTTSNLQRKSITYVVIKQHLYRAVRPMRFELGTDGNLNVMRI